MLFIIPWFAYKVITSDKQEEEDVQNVYDKNDLTLFWKEHDEAKIVLLAYNHQPPIVKPIKTDSYSSGALNLLYCRLGLLNHLIVTYKLFDQGIDDKTMDQYNTLMARIKKTNEMIKTQYESVHMIDEKTSREVKLKCLDTLRKIEESIEKPERHDEYMSSNTYRIGFEKEIMIFIIREFYKDNDSIEKELMMTIEVVSSSKFEAISKFMSDMEKSAVRSHLTREQIPALSEDNFTF